MTMPRWRLTTWAFLILNVVMVGLAGLVLFDPFAPSSSCDHIPYGVEYASDRTACAMGAGLGGAVESFFRMAAIVIVWPIGLIIIGIAWATTRDDASDAND